MTVNKNIKIDASQASAFNTIETAEMVPVFQGDFVHGLNSQIWNTAVVSGTGATVDTDSSRLRVQSGTGSTGYAYITSRRVIRYRAGQGTTTRFTPVFTTGVANNIQLFGVGQIVSNLPFNGYFFGFNGTTFGIAHYNNSSTPTWYAQTAWNGDKVDGSAGSSFNWDKTKGSPVMIKYPYLGYGNVTFWIQNPTTSEWRLVHTIRYSNSSATTELSNPNLQIMAFTLNSGNTSNITMYCGSVGAFISGQRSYVGNPQWAMDNFKTAITTETNILTLRNATTYNGVTNRGLIRLNSLSASNSANTTCFIRLKINATLGGTPSFTTINGTTANNGVTITNGNSVASYDTAGTTVTGGTYIFNMSVGPAGMQMIDLTDLNLFIAPGETATFSGFALANTTIGVSVNWSEDI